MNNNIEKKLFNHIKTREASVDLLNKYGLAILKQDIQKMSDIQDRQQDSPSDLVTYKSMTIELVNYGYEEFRFQGSDSSGYYILAKKKGSNVRHAIRGIPKNNNEDTNKLEEQCESEIKLLKECSGSSYTLNLLDVKKGEKAIYLILNETKGTLKQLLEEQGGKLPELSVIKYANDIAQGIYYIHKQGHIVQHLNLDMILIDCNNNAVVKNFSLGDLENSLYSAPEIDKNYQEKYAKDNIQVSLSHSKMSDAFSFGYIIYSLLFGETELKRYENKKEISLDLSNLSDSSNIKEFLESIIQGLTKFNPNERMSIYHSFLLLKGNVSLKFNLEQKFKTFFSGNQEELYQQYENKIEIIQQTETSSYPIIDKNDIFSSPQSQADPSKLNENKQMNNSEGQKSGNQKIETLLESIKKVHKELEIFEKQIGEDIFQDQELQTPIKDLQLQIKSKDEEILDLTNQISGIKLDHEMQLKNLLEKNSAKDKEMELLQKKLDQNDLQNLKHIKSLEIALENEKQNNLNLTQQIKQLTPSKQIYQGPGWYCNPCGKYNGVKYGYSYGDIVKFYCQRCQMETYQTLKC